MGSGLCPTPRWRSFGRLTAAKIVLKVLSGSKPGCSWPGFTCLGSGLGCRQSPLNHSCIHLRIRNGICVCPQMYHVHTERPLRVIAVSSYLKYHRDTHNGNCCVFVNEVLHTRIHMQKNTKYTYIIIYAYMQTYIHTNKQTYIYT